MKRTLFILIQLLTTLLSYSQNIGDAFYIYRNDGEFNAFLREEVDSITYSNYDTDSLYHEEIVLQLVHTTDSIYKIPLSVIDSVSFVQPETIYRPETVQLAEQLYDYIIKVDGMTITLSSTTPSVLLPQKGDKLAALEFYEKIPSGFVGSVADVFKTDDGYIVSCDFLDISEVADRFYGVVNIVDNSGESEAKRKSAPSNRKNGDFCFDIPELHFSVDPSGVFKTKDIAGFKGGFGVEYKVKPVITGKLVRVVDASLLLSYLHLHAVSNIKTNVDVSVAGEFFAEKKVSFLEKTWIIYGFPVFINLGPKIAASMDLALGSTINFDFTHTLDINYYPVTSLYPALMPFVNRLKQKAEYKNFDLDMPYVVADGELKAGINATVGVGWEDFAWAGVEFEAGSKAEFEFKYDSDEIDTASENTVFYDGVKSSNVTIMPYWDAYGVIEGFDDVRWDAGGEYSFFGKKFYEDYILPRFDNVKLTQVSGSQNKYIASTNVGSGGLVPFSVGFAIYNEEGKMLCPPTYYNSKYTNNKDLPSYHIEFEDLPSGEIYWAYPVIKLFGFDVLASPFAELDTSCPVSISGFRQTEAQYSEKAFTNDGKTYDYRFVADFNVTCDESDKYSDWGIVCEDPQGNKKQMSLKSYGSYFSSTDNVFYGNKAKENLKIYGYVKNNSDAYTYGKKKTYALIYGDAGLCPDSNHPHAIDLGIGTKWACCNIGASSPTDFGSYFRWGETKEWQWLDSNYNNPLYDELSNYYHEIDVDDDGTPEESWIDISCSKYDAAYINWGGNWCMPKMSDFKQLEECTWTDDVEINGVTGMLFTGPNGNCIFMPYTGTFREEPIPVYKKNGNYVVYYDNSPWSYDFPWLYDACFGGDDEYVFKDKDDILFIYNNLGHVIGVVKYPDNIGSPSFEDINDGFTGEGYITGYILEGSGLFPEAADYECQKHVIDTDEYFYYDRPEIGFDGASHGVWHGYMWVGWPKTIRPVYR